MTSDRMAKNLIDQARYRMTLVEKAFKDRQFATAVRESQEAVELALKGALRAVGIEPPHWHDVGDVLRANGSRLGASVQAELERVLAISKELGEHRQPALYGDEDAGLGPDDLYGETQARKAVEDAKFVVDRVSRSFPPTQ